MVGRVNLKPETVKPETSLMVGRVNLKLETLKPETGLMVGRMNLKPETVKPETDDRLRTYTAPSVTSGSCRYSCTFS